MSDGFLADSVDMTLSSL